MSLATKKRSQKLKTEDYILYLLNKLEPSRSDKIKLNKIAFLVEFAYILKTKQELTDTEYAAIDYGPVINGYDSVLKNLQKEKKIKIDGYKLFVAKSVDVDVAPEICSVIDPLIEKYSQLSNGELISISHDTDSYKITTKNETIMGLKINKKFAALESFLADESFEYDKNDESQLPQIDKEKLIPYKLNG